MTTGIFGWLPHVTATCRPTVAGPEALASADAPIKQAQPGADDYSMRRAATAIVLIALALLLVAPFVRGLLFIAVLAALTVTLFVVAGRRIRRSGASLVPWLVALAVGVVTTAPQVATAHYKHVGGGVFAGVFWSLVAAVYLRLVIFLADYFRRRRSGLAVDRRADGHLALLACSTSNRRPHGSNRA